MQKVFRKRVTERMKVDCLLALAHTQFGVHLRCAISGEDMKPGAPVEFDHIHALVHGGEHTYQNLRPVLSEAHKRKTAQDIRDDAKVTRLIAGKKKRRGKRFMGSGELARRRA